MNPGAFNKRIWLLRYTEETDASGLTTQNFKPIIGHAIWAQASPVSGREYSDEKKTKNDDTVRFTIRYRIGVGNCQVVEYQNSHYYVQSVVDPNEAHEILILTCSIKERGNTNHETRGFH